MRDWLAGLPPATRWALLGVAVVVVGLLVAGSVWEIGRQRAASARAAFITASATARDALAATEEAKLEAAARALTQYVADYPRSADAGQAWYTLANVEYQRRRYDAALTAFGEAAGRSRGSLGALSRLGSGYAWEAKGDPARALQAYQDALRALRPDAQADKRPEHFLYGDVMVAIGRAQEQLKQTAAAIETYRRLLKDAPATPRGDEVRTRLAILGASA